MFLLQVHTLHPDSIIKIANTKIKVVKYIHILIVSEPGLIKYLKAIAMTKVRAGRALTMAAVNVADVYVIPT